MPSRFIGDRSVAKMAGVNPRLVSLVHESFNLSPVPFLVTEGVRSPERQAYLFHSGKSKTLLSRHLLQPDGFGAAVDIACIKDGKISWDFGLYKQVASAFYDASSRLGVKVIWGGSWPRFADGCHFELA